MSIKEQIINNTELKHYYNNELALDKTPVKFEFFVMGKALLSTIVSGFKSYLKIDPESIIRDLERRGFSSSQIEQELPKAIKPNFKQSNLC